MEICVSDHDHDCFTNLGFADDVLLFATSKEQFQKMLCEFKKSTEKWTQDPPRKDESSQQPKLGHKKKLKSLTFVEISATGESGRYLGQQITFQHQETTEIRNRIRAAWVTFHKYRQVPITLMRVLCLVFSVIVPAVSNDTWIQRNNVEANFCCFHRIFVFGVRFLVVKNILLQDTSQGGSQEMWKTQAAHLSLKNTTTASSSSRTTTSSCLPLRQMRRLPMRTTTCLKRTTQRCT